jgi:hypothetical protein
VLEILALQPAGPFPGALYTQGLFTHGLISSLQISVPISSSMFTQLTHLVISRVISYCDCGACPGERLTFFSPMYGPYYRTELSTRTVTRGCPHVDPNTIDKT